MSSLAERNNYLSIGQVVNLLRGRYPDLSNSKIRYLEQEGLITPHRTPKGYRQYSQEDVDRIELILHLQKTRYMPLDVIKQKLDSTDDINTLAYEVGLLSDAPMKTEPKETKQKLHPIETVPDLLGVDIAFLHQLAENDLITIHKSPQNRELIDGRDFEIIKYCAELQRYHIEPRNLRQYVSAANRESTMFEQVLVGMLGSDTSDDDRQEKLERAFNKLHELTSGVQTALLKNRVFESLDALPEDADVDAIDDELTRAENEAGKMGERDGDSDAAGDATETIKPLDVGELKRKPTRNNPKQTS